LNVLEFNSTRKRMSVVVKNEEGKIFLFTKGADRYVSSVISNLLGCVKIILSLFNAFLLT